MTEEFKSVALYELRKSFPLADKDKLMGIAQILWELIPRIYNEAANDKK